MISDILFQLVLDLDHYLTDPDFDHVYVGETRDAIIRLRDEADNLRSALDRPPVVIPPADEHPDHAGSTGSEVVAQMMSDETVFDLTTPFFSRADLRRRGWPKGQIDQLLGRRDWESPNPHCPGAAPMSCWEETRVLQAENTEAFRQSGRKIGGRGVPVPG
jgi:hypothetical protein